MSEFKVNKRSNKMSRESKADAATRKVREAEEYKAQIQQNYPVRVMSLLARALRVNFDIDVVDQKFVMFDRDERADTYAFSSVYSVEDSDTLDDLEYEIYRKELQATERKRLALIRQTAIDKLTDEERRVLNLN